MDSAAVPEGMAAVLLNLSKKFSDGIEKTAVSML